MLIVELTAANCLDLRRRVLRNGTPSDDPRFPEDDAAGTFHLGARDDERHLVAVITFTPQPTALRPGLRAVQLRGMATDAAVQRSGAGRALFTAGVDRLRVDGVEVLWAKARDSALGFYERVGMHAEGAGYVTEETGLPHHTVVMDL
jgi:predicted N-acetyltransferase YhbS